MNEQTRYSRLAKYSTTAAGWVGKSLIVLTLLAALGFTQNFYGFDVRLNNGAPMVEVRLVLLNKMPHVSWHKAADFLGRLFHIQQPAQQACRCDEPAQSGRKTG